MLTDAGWDFNYTCKFLGTQGAAKFRDWIKKAVASNQAYDRFAHDVLTGSGSNLDNPPASYYKVLRSAGVEVVGAAQDGIEGVHTVLQQKPDLVLMDCNIPVMSGIDAARRILSSYPVCIVMLSGYSTDHQEERALEAGICAYLHKPVTGDTLLPALEAAYSRYQSP